MKNHHDRIDRFAVWLIAVGALNAGVHDTHASEPNAGRTAAARSTHRASGPPFTLECVSVAKGSGLLSDDSIGVIGQPVVGTISNAQFTVCQLQDAATIGATITGEVNVEASIRADGW